MSPKPIPQFNDKQLASFWMRVDRRGPDECWAWTGAVSAYGRGLFCPCKPGWFAPRVAWAIANGQDPEAAEVCHSCDNPNCVNPAHLWLGSHSDNMRDAATKGRLQKELPAVCCRGHSMNGSNVRLRRDNGNRICRACVNLRANRRDEVRRRLGLPKGASFSISEIGEPVLSNPIEPRRRAA